MLIAFDNSLHWDVVAKVMIRARGLKALKLEGPQLVFVQSWIDYIGCNLKVLILRYVDIKVSIAKYIWSSLLMKRSDVSSPLTWYTGLSVYICRLTFSVRYSADQEQV